MSDGHRHNCFTKTNCLKSAFLAHKLKLISSLLKHQTKYAYSEINLRKLLLLLMETPAIIIIQTIISDRQDSSILFTAVPIQVTKAGN